MEQATTPETTAPYPELTAAWNDFFASVRRARGRAARNAGALSLPQYHLLEAVDSLPEPRCGEVAETAGIAASTASRMIDTLVRDGLVERRESSCDRRAIEVVLTDDGQAALGCRREEIEGKLTRLFGELSPDERDSAQRLLQKLSALIDEL